MTFNIGDKVRSQGGVEGEIVAAGNDTRSVTVKVLGVWRGTGLVSIPMIRLQVIKAYTAKRDCR